VGGETPLCAPTPPLLYPLLPLSPITYLALYMSVGFAFTDKRERERESETLEFSTLKIQNFKKQNNTLEILRRNSRFVYIHQPLYTSEHPSFASFLR
jgi:hypothetical protein